MAKKNKKPRKWNRAHEFKKRSPTKSVSGHPSYIFAKSGNKRRYLAFTHSPTTHGKDNEKMAKNIDGSDEPCYVRIIPLTANAEDFVKPDKVYEIRTAEDRERIKRLTKK